MGSRRSIKQMAHVYVVVSIAPLAGNSDRYLPGYWKPVRDRVMRETGCGRARLRKEGEELARALREGSARQWKRGRRFSTWGLRYNHPEKTN